MAKRKMFDSENKRLFMLLAVSFIGFALALTAYFVDYLVYKETYEFLDKTYVWADYRFVLFEFEEPFYLPADDGDVKYNMIVILAIFTIVASAVVFVGILQNIFMPKSIKKFKFLRVIIYLLTILYAVAGFVVAIMECNDGVYDWHLGAGAWLMLIGGLLSGFCGILSLKNVLY